MASTMLLHQPHSTPFDWILTWAPQAELGYWVASCLADMRKRGGLPHPEVPNPDERESQSDIHTDQPRADRRE